VKIFFCDEKGKIQILEGVYKSNSKTSLYMKVFYSIKYQYHCRTHDLTALDASTKQLHHRVCQLTLESTTNHTQGNVIWKSSIWSTSFSWHLVKMMVYSHKVRIIF